MSGPVVPKGGRIGLIAPAGRFAIPQLQAGIDVLGAQGYVVVPAPNLWATDRYHAGTIAERLADLRWALEARDLDAVWLARGGYGCAQLLAGLRPALHNPKPLLGFSDGTALHAALLKTGWLRDRGALLHAPVVHTLAPAGEQGSLQPVLVDLVSRQHLWQLLETGSVGPLSGQGVQHLGLLPVRGPVVGGNLTVLASLCGTPWQLQARGCIALIEDVAEAPYRLDRAITQLVESGSLDGVLAIGLGEFSSCTAVDARPCDGVAMVCERLHSLGVPVVCNLPFGHGPRNLAWPVGSIGGLSSTSLYFE
jgi:muramoyltetrapeptide carboxypeptidase